MSLTPLELHELKKALENKTEKEERRKAEILATMVALQTPRGKRKPKVEDFMPPKPKKQQTSKTLYEKARLLTLQLGGTIKE